MEKREFYMGFCKKIIKNVFPYGAVRWMQDNFRIISDLKHPFVAVENMCTIKKNRKLKNLYNGERCFILCTGPTINEQPIEKLKNEFVFGVSSGYLHDKYPLIHPQFHCMPQFTYTEKCTKEFAVEYLRNMDENTFSNTKMFFSDTERKIIENNHFFADKEVFYISFSGVMSLTDKEVYDISTYVPEISTVPIMAIMLAMYMGFKTIYLLGVEYNHGFTKKYVHAMDNEMVRKIEKNDSGTNDNNELVVKNYEFWKGMTQAFFQFRALHNIAIKNGIEIFNATPDGMIDEFERVNFEEIFVL